MSYFTSTTQNIRFMTDPNHKETLSGRVTTACLNCRRKKIKCSGEVNCMTCQERDVVCEGPPERKRPRQNGSIASSRDPSPEASNRQDLSSQDRPSLSRVGSGGLHRSFSSPAANIRTPAENLSLAVDSDAPFANTVANVSTTSMVNPASQQRSPLTFNTMPLAFGTMPISSTSTLGSRDLYPGSRADPTFYADHGPESAAASATAGLNARKPALSPATVDRRESRALDSSRLSRDLVSAAEVLERQALSLRIMASQQHGEPFTDLMRSKSLGEGSNEFLETRALDLESTSAPIPRQQRASEQPRRQSRRGGSMSQARDYACYWGFIDELASSQSQQSTQAPLPAALSSTYTAKRAPQDRAPYPK